MQTGHVASRSEAGRRDSNEDCRGFEVAPDGESALLVVSDGMGGHACGEVAAAIVVDRVLDYYRQASFTMDESQLREVLALAHTAVQAVAAEDPSRSGMGATAVIAAITLSGSQPHLLVGHVGDSRALQFREGCVRRLTRDQLFVVEVLGVAEEQAKRHPRGHVLSQAVGVGQTIEPEINQWDLEPGDVLLLCSDGVSDVVSELEMHGFLDTVAPGDSSLDDCAAAMLRRAFENQSQDNFTVLLAQIPAVPEEGGTSR